jgi:hydrogenase-1 operon protein HyaF
MSRLSDIPIRIEPPDSPVSALTGDEGLGRGSNAILIELSSLLEGLVRSNTPGAIDLHSMPMTARDRTRLQDKLGRGEVRAFLDAEGVSEVQETAIPGIWWIQHRDKAGELIAELIEVTTIPAILARASDEIADGIGMLQERIALPDQNQLIAPQYGR